MGHHFTDKKKEEIRKAAKLEAEAEYRASAEYKITAAIVAIGFSVVVIALCLVISTINLFIH